MNSYDKSTNEPDPFSSFREEALPVILRDIEDALDAPSGVALRPLVFASRGAACNEVYALIARPAAAGVYPGLLLMHGGAGCAEKKRALAWAARGYIVLTLDIPTVAKAESCPHSVGRWKSLPYEAERWNVTDNPEDAAIHQGVAAAVQALWLLRAQPGVDRDNVGVHGISWGGYMTAMVCALAGDRVKAAFSVYGSGHYEHCRYWADCLAVLSPERRERWLRWFDPARRASAITAAYFIAGATNDQAFWPPAVEATLAAVSGPVNRLYAPNANHMLPIPGGTADGKDNWAEMAVLYFDYLLKGVGEALPALAWETLSVKPAGMLAVRVVGPRPPVEIALHYSRADEPDWRKRLWGRVPMTRVAADRFEARLPVGLDAPFDCFALMSEDRPVSVSTPMTFGVL